MTASSSDEQAGPDLYQVLGLNPGASRAEITRAYRRLARRYHPDVDTTPGAAQRFADVTRAYRVLSDPRARARYDSSRAPRGSRIPTRSHPGSWSPWTTARVRPGSTPREAFWLGAPTLAHAFHLGTDMPVGPPADSEEAEVELTLEESCHGTTRAVTVTSQHSSETLHVVIPPGVLDGDRIEVPTTHLPGGRGTPAVFLRVKLAPLEPYELDGRDVHVRLLLSPWEAALGVTITLDTPRGPVNLDVPAGTCTGQVLSLPGHGIPNPSGPAGDLCAHARIVVPAQLTPLERDLFRQLAAASTFNPRTAAVAARTRPDQ